MSISTNTYLTGNWGPVREERDIDDLVVIGQLPEGLSGMFVRNGPNPQFDPVGDYHWFDGDGMLHAVRIGQGKASYLNRFVQTRGYKIEHEAGHALWTGALEPPQRGMPQQSVFIRYKKNAANTALSWHAGKLLAFWDTGEPYRLNSADLRTIGPYDFDGGLDFPMTSHPKIDPVTNDMMFFGGTLRGESVISYGVVSRDGAISHKVDIPIRFPMYSHDFAITQNFTILIDTPFKFDIAGQAERGTPYNFCRDIPCRFGVIPRFGAASDIRWFETSPCFVPHTLNAYEDGDEIVLVGNRVGTVAIGPEQSRGGPFYTEEPSLHRWRLNRLTGATMDEALDDLPIEFPVPDETRIGRPNRYGYAARLSKIGYSADAIVKYDLHSGARQIAEHGPDRLGGVVVFVARPGRQLEDEGWLLGYVHDESVGTSELVIWDAQGPAAGPVARVLIPQPHRVPYGVHGIWLSDEKIAATVAA